MRKFVICLFLTLSLPMLAQLKGKIIKVSDGDTVTLLDSANTKYTIRLNGIDAPESGQAYGKIATQYLSSLIFNKTVRVDVKGTDVYKRTLGVIYLNDLNVNGEMIRAGYAWNYKYSKDKYYIKLQDEARENRRGLWQGKDPLDPYLFRKQKKANGKKL